MKILVTGGAGYIGSAMVRALLDKKHHVTVFDNLSTGFRSFVPKEAVFHKGDLRNNAEVDRFIDRHRVEAVMHFAASCLVGESVADPAKYYENNVLGSVNLLNAMRRKKIRHFIFSSSCAIYGQPKQVPITEKAPPCPANPYGQSKLMVETLLKGLAKAGEMAAIALRYFNAAGAHHDGGIGERHDPETHLIPNIFKVITGQTRYLAIFGDDYPTEDGTCIRDYIHIEDLVAAHLLALETLIKKKMPSDAFNLGTQSGYSVKQIVGEVERITGRKVPFKIHPRRPGDPPRLIACALKAGKVLGWKPRHNLEDIILSAWRWENSRECRRLR